MEYTMQTDKPLKMDEAQREQLRNIDLAPYMQLSTELIKKARHAGGNMFRHQLATMAILIDYGYIDAVLLKASLVHDCIEDVKDFDIKRIIGADADGEAVYNLVMEVSRREGEKKSDFLQRIIKTGTQKAKVLKCADRISNMTDLGYVTDCAFIERYCDETEFYMLPTAIEIDYNMYQELIELIISRRKYLEDSGWIDMHKG